MNKYPNTYDVIYLLEPAYEDLKKGGPGWWKLKWKPIWLHTYSVYQESVWSWVWLPHVRHLNWDARNGWHRSFKHRLLIFTWLKLRFCFWVRWDFMVHQDGPSDVSVKRPLDLSRVKR